MVICTVNNALHTVTGDGVVSGTYCYRGWGCEWYILLQEMGLLVVHIVTGDGVVSGTYCYRGWGCEWYVLLQGMGL